jgi:hypothetical protein
MAHLVLMHSGEQWDLNLVCEISRDENKCVIVDNSKKFSSSIGWRSDICQENLSENSFVKENFFLMRNVCGDWYFVNPKWVSETVYHYSNFKIYFRVYNGKRLWNTFPSMPYADWVGIKRDPQILIKRVTVTANDNKPYEDLMLRDCYEPTINLECLGPELWSGKILWQTRAPFWWTPKNYVLSIRQGETIITRITTDKDEKIYNWKDWTIKFEW